MPSRAVSEERVQVFLRRRRRGTGLVQPAPLSALLAETLDLASRLVPSQAGSLLLDDPTQPRSRSPLTFVAAFGPASEQLVGMRVPSGRGVVGAVYRSGDTHATSNASEDPSFYAGVDERASFHTRSLVATPIHLERAVCGVFELVNRKGRKSYSERDVELVELVARYMSRAILNAVDIVKHNELVFRDDLTGLRNSRGLEQFIEQAASAAREGADAAVLYIDVDRLKRVNDKLGHRAGSEVLRRVGRAIAAAVDDRGVAFRLGGDEFVVVCSETEVKDAEAIAGDVRREVRTATPGPMRWGGRIPAMSVSIGVATVQCSLRSKGAKRGPKRGARLLTAADHALYRAKRAGRGKVTRATRRDDTLGRGRRR